MLLMRINVPKDEVDAVTEKVYQRRYQEMFTFIEDYDVQETRRLAREEGRAKGREETKDESAKEMLLDGQQPENISKWLKMPLDRVIKIKKSLME